MVIQFRSMRGLQVSCFVALSFDALSKKISEEEKKKGGVGQKFKEIVPESG